MLNFIPENLWANTKIAVKTSKWVLDWFDKNKI